MTYPIFQAGHRVRIISYGPFRGLIGTIRIVDTIVDLIEPFCFYLVDLEGVLTKEPEWFEYDETIFLGTVSVLSGLLALKLVLGYFLISPLGNQSNVPFGEMLGFALAFTGTFVDDVWIWRSHPEGIWWSPPDGWPRAKKATSKSLEKQHRQLGSPEDAVV